MMYIEKAKDKVMKEGYKILMILEVKNADGIVYIFARRKNDEYDRTVYCFSFVDHGGNYDYEDNLDDCLKDKFIEYGKTN